jgi:hypothetical protein
MADVMIKQNDTFPPLVVTVEDASGPVDLTGSTVELWFRRQADSSVFHGTASLLNQSTNTGQAEYQWIPTDTAVKGVILFEVRVTFVDTRRMTLPVSGYFSVVVIDDIDEAGD